MKFNFDLEANQEILKRSPLAQLSLSSSELFHSNFIAWLCVTYPQVACNLFGRFVRVPPNGIMGVEREVKNIDLWLHFDNEEQLIIENKVKSIPTRSQLDDYSSKVGTAFTSFLLLSLSRPNFLSNSGDCCNDCYKDCNGKNWSYLSYAKLAESLRDALSNITDTYHRFIVEDYIDYVTVLHALYSHYSLESVLTNCFFEPMEKVSSPRDRFFSGVVKMRYAQLASMLDKELENRKFATAPGVAGSVSTGAGMSRGMGLLDFKYSLFGGNEPFEPLILGVQLQHDQFRLVVERDTGAKQAAEILDDATGAGRHWFDFRLPELPTDGTEYPGNGRFNKFGDAFYYRYKRLGRNISPKAIVEAIVTYAEFLRANTAVLRKRVLATS